MNSALLLMIWLLPLLLATLARQRYAHWLLPLAALPGLLAAAAITGRHHGFAALAAAGQRTRHR